MKFETRIHLEKICRWGASFCKNGSIHWCEIELNALHHHSSGTQPGPYSFQFQFEISKD